MVASLGDCLMEVIGVVHLPRLPRVSSSVRFDLNGLVDRVVWEARVLEELGYTGVIVENFGDLPFEKRVRDPLAIAAMTVVVREVVRNTGFRVGVNLLRNSGLEAYSIAVATGAKFIRVNALVETVITDSGIIEPEAPRLRDVRLNYPGVEVYADIFVKHAAGLRHTLGLLEAGSPVAKSSFEDYVKELVEEYVERGHADALIVTGTRTGSPPPENLVRLVKKYSPIPVLVGSGATPENLDWIIRHADGVIVGSYIKRNGKAGNPLDPERARTFINKARELATLRKK